MNKHRRYELKMLKYKKRLRNLRIKGNEGGNYFSFRSHGSPCSCKMCSPNKYNRAKEKQMVPDIIEFGLNYDSGELEYDFDKGIFVEHIEDYEANLMAKELIMNFE